MRFSRNIFCSSVLALCLVACSDDSAAINDAIVAISSSSETFNESSSEMSGNSVVSSSDALSSENLISSSSEVEATSSTAVSSSSVSRFEGIVFRNGDKKTAVQKSDIDSVKTQAAGRFWLVMRDPLNQKETESLENIGIYRQRCYEGYRYYLYDYNGPSRDDLGYMCLCLMKAEKDVQKSAIDSRINEFYNSFDADETVAEGIVWESRDQKTVVKRFGDDSLMTQAKEARASLEAFGVETLSCSALHTESLDMGICFMKGARDIQKATMDSLIVGFYNTFNVDDTTKLEFDYTGAHWVVEDVSLEIVVGCWEDVPMDACKEIVKTCKGEDAALDRSIILSND